MSTLIKSLGLEVWQSVVTGWTTLTKIEKERKVMKFESNWNYEERKASSRNFTTLWAIQCGMDDKMFRLIVASKFVKKSWDIFQEKFEGSGYKDRKKE